MEKLSWTEKNLICAGLDSLIIQWEGNIQFAIDHPVNEEDTGEVIETCMRVIEDYERIKEKVSGPTWRGS